MDYDKFPIYQKTALIPYCIRNDIDAKGEGRSLMDGKRNLLNSISAEPTATLTMVRRRPTVPKKPSPKAHEEGKREESTGCPSGS
ncbi:hypothetical protein Trydic_g2544 [Trypoxylus dichotomus]